MPNALKPGHSDRAETDRLAALAEYGILDTLPEQGFDDLTRLASRICGCPISLVSLVDASRQWFKSRVGLDVEETSRDIAFCDYAIRDTELMIVFDAAKDQRFAANPLVISEPGIRFYAGMPLVTDDGFALGTLCVIDRVPKDLDAGQREALRALARQAVAQLELRKRLARSHVELDEGQRTAALLSAQREIVEMIVRGADLSDVLDQLARLIEVHAEPGGLVSIMQVDSENQLLRHGAAPSLPEEYNEKVDGVPIGPSGGSCIKAAFTGEPVISPSIADDPVWRQYAHLPLDYGLYASWSTPVLGRDDTVLAVIGMYYREIRAPSLRDLRLVGLMARTAALAIEHKRADDERRALFESERRARASAEQANRQKDEFISVVSHELRTPLNAILGWAHLLRTEVLAEPTRAKGLEAIERNAKAQARIVDDLLDVARIVSGKLALDIEVVELGTVVKRALDSVRLLAEKKSIRLECVLESDSTLVHGDSDRLMQIVANLVSNSIKFTPEHGRVEVRVRRDEDQLCLQVTDSGCGISPEFLPQLFGRFSQAEASRTRRHSGLGLGLAIVAHLTELHGGSVTARSDGEGRGSVFCVFLPALQGAGLEPSSRDDREARRCAPAPSLHGVRVLVVEDDADSRELLRSALERAGACVAEAASATEALRLLSEQIPQVMISDIEMPEMDGYELVERVRAFPLAQGGALRAVALTAHASPADRERALQAGFDAHVAKPAAPASVIEVVRRMVAQSAALADAP